MTPPILGRTYHDRYGYSWRWAIWAEICWRVEHLPWAYDGQVFARLARWGYRHRKQAERAADPVLRSDARVGGER